MQLIKDSIKVSELSKMAGENASGLVKAVVDTEQEIMAIGGEMHSDEEVFLGEQANSKRPDLWGINIYPQKAPAERVEFDSMINLKPDLGNRSRGVEDEETRKRIVRVVDKLIIT